MICTLHKVKSYNKSIYMYHIEIEMAIEINLHVIYRSICNM